MPVYVLFAALAVSASIPILWWSLAADTRRSSVADNQGGALDNQVTDTRKLVLEQSASGRVVMPAVKSFGATLSKLTPVGWVTSLRRHLTLGGSLGDSYALERTLVLKVALGVLGFFVGFLLLRNFSTLPRIALMVVFVATGFFLPDALVARRGRLRQEQIELEMPDTLDQVTMAVEAGLGFEAALARAARTGDGPLAQELHRTLREIQLGIPRNQALHQLAERTDVPDLSSFVRVIVQSEQYGIPIGPVLCVQADELRDKRRERAEERALKIPVLLIFPLAFCIFPSLFIVLLGPAAIRIAESLGDLV